MMKNITIPMKYSETAVVIRPAQPQDAVALMEMHGRLSSDSIYSRYLRQYTPGYDELLDLCTLPTGKGAAFVVVNEFPWETMIGFGYYLIDKGRYPKTAEPAVLIEDRFQGRGLGRALMQQLADHARQNGVQLFDVLVHQANQAMLHILPRIGSELERSAGFGSIELTIQLGTAYPLQRAATYGLATAV